MVMDMKLDSIRHKTVKTDSKITKAKVIGGTQISIERFPSWRASVRYFSMKGMAELTPRVIKPRIWMATRNLR